MFRFIAFIVVALVGAAMARLGGDPVLRKEQGCVGCTDVCSLLPPDGVKFPCYEGTPSDAAHCFATDPILKDGTTWQCATCSSNGYTKNIGNDPIYRSMQLYLKE